MRWLIGPRAGWVYWDGQRWVSLWFTLGLINSMVVGGIILCGNYGVFWRGPAQDPNPGWVKQGLDGLLRRLIVRGGKAPGRSPSKMGQFI